ncbi:MAG: polymer-forming cytoskeletal protein [Candidatus Magasanikbacteria bacterium]|nr:polymer-forming cytoskeletal protein [Candidatus Magasanikbacteria bacterium]
MFQKTPRPGLPQQEYAPGVSPDEVETVVGPSVRVEGDFASEGNIVVKGIVSGSVKTSKVLTVEKGASIFANVRAGNAAISGNVKGNVKVGDRLDLSDTAQVAGDIDCRVLSVAPGALIQGKVSMKGIEIADDKKEEKRGGFMSKIKSRPEEETGDTVVSM